MSTQSHSRGESDATSTVMAKEDPTLSQTLLDIKEKNDNSPSTTSLPTPDYIEKCSEKHDSESSLVTHYTESDDGSSEFSDDDSSSPLVNPAVFVEVCNLCNEHMCTECDPDTDHVCSQYMEAARKRNGNSLRGNEYMSMVCWTNQCCRNVILPSKFFRDLDIGTGGMWEGTRWWGLRWGLWAVATVVMLVAWPFMMVAGWLSVLVEDSVWREN